MNKVIKLDEYKQRKTNKKRIKLNHINNLKKQEDNNRQDTLDLFMRVLERIRKESY